jgi:hypothetical protein
MTDEFAAPDPAFFEPPRQEGKHIGVELSSGIDSTLGQIYALTWPKIMQTGIILQAWLTPADGGEIAAHVGEWELGTIPSSAAPVFEQTMREALLRGEFPKLPGRIARLGQPPRCVVEIASPAAW